MGADMFLLLRLLLFLVVGQPTSSNLNAVTLKCDSSKGLLDICHGIWRGRGEYLLPPSNSFPFVEIQMTSFANSILDCGSTDSVRRLYFKQSHYDKIRTPCGHVRNCERIEVIIQGNVKTSRQLCVNNESFENSASINIDSTVSSTTHSITLNTFDGVATTASKMVTVSDDGVAVTTTTERVTASGIESSTPTFISITSESVSFGLLLVGNLLGGLSVLLISVALLYLWCKWLRRQRGTPILPKATSSPTPPPTPPPQIPTTSHTSPQPQSSPPPPPPPPPPPAITPTPMRVLQPISFDGTPRLPKSEVYTPASTQPLITPETLQQGRYNLRSTGGRPRKL